MKIHAFHLMPYPDLPDDFKERHHSVWVDLPVRDAYDPDRGADLYEEYLDELEYAAEVGFDGICVNEHHQCGYGFVPSPNIMAGTLARRTADVGIVVMGNSVALYNPPVRIAEEMAMLDTISRGRLVSGFPLGTPFDTAYSYGANPVTLREKYREGVRLILRSWTSEEPFAFNGKYTQLRYVNPWPRPVQQPHPPVWVPGSGSPETWEWCAQNNFLYACLSYFGWQRGKQALAGYWRRIAELGLEPNPYRGAFLQFVGVADNDAEAEELYAEHASYFFNRCMHIYPGFMNPPGYTSVDTMVKNMGAGGSMAKGWAPQLSWAEMVAQGIVIAGSPQTVVDELTRLREELHVGHLMVLSHFGSMPRETAMYNTKRIGEEIIPALRGHFDDWEDHWWPAAARANDGVRT